MRKNNKSDMPKRGLAPKDIIVIVLSLVALAGLIGTILVSNAAEQRLLDDLSASGSGMADGSAGKVPTATVCLNEVNAGGWVEFYNGNEHAVSLAGHSLWLNGEEVWAFGADAVLEQGGFLAADMGGFNPGQENVIALRDADGAELSQFFTPVLAGQESYARVEDGGLAFAYQAGSRGATNKGAQPVEKNELVFSVPGGFYDEALLLELWAPKGCDIYYTTDGSAPGNTSEKYQSPLSIQPMIGSNYRYAAAKGIEYENGYKPESIHMGTVVRAIAVKDGVQVGEEKTQSYFIALNGLKAYSGLPALSITAQPESLFDYFEGIYVLGRTHEDSLARGDDGGGMANYMQEWDRPAHIEFYEPAKGKTYQGDISLAIRKDASVTTPQKSFLMHLTGAQVSKGSSLNRFLYGDTQILELSTFGKDNNYKLREMVAYDLLQGSAAGVPQLVACNVFINGEFWGTYLLRQPWDADTIEEMYNVQKDDVVIAWGGTVAEDQDQALYDEMLAFVQENDMADEENFLQLQEMMDLDSYLDYFAANIYLANAGYGVNPTVMWRSRNTGAGTYGDGRWRWLMFGMDNTMANGMDGEICSSSIDTFLQPGVVGDAFFLALLENPQFREMLVDRMAQMEQEVFTPQRAQESITRCAAGMAQASLNSYRRFFGRAADTFVADEVDKITAFFEERGAYIQRYTREVVEGNAPWDLPDTRDEDASEPDDGPAFREDGETEDGGETEP